MVFSSLKAATATRQPQSRLHMPMNRNNRDRDLRSGPGLQLPGECQAPGRRVTPQTAASPPARRGPRAQEPAHLPEPPSHNGVLFPNLKTVQPVLPFYRSPATPAELANTPGICPPSLCCPRPSGTAGFQQRHLTPRLPKKKSASPVCPSNRRRPWRQQTRRAAL